jgi:hypothetical protein
MTEDQETLGAAHLYKSAAPNASIKSTGQLSDEVGMSVASGLFTQDSRINDYAKINSFYEKQKHLSEIAFKRKGQVFGCYGEIVE